VSKKSASQAARRAKKGARRKARKSRPSKGKPSICSACREHPAIGWQLGNQGNARHVCGHCAAPGQTLLRRRPWLLQSSPGFMI
jgi:hypothetical protein